MIQETSVVKFNQPEKPGYFRMGLTCGPGYKLARPGQFVTARLPQFSSPLLRRPFSIHRLIRSENEAVGIEILYRVVGEFTQNLAALRPGAELDLMGPLGRGFTVSKDLARVALVGGGIGVAPLVFLAEALNGAGVDLSGSLACIGGRTENDILAEARFKQLKMDVIITTEDGSAGRKGLVIAPLEHWLKSNTPDMIYACGPMPMLKVVGAMAHQRSLPCELSIETMMACGMGACLGCAVKTADAPDRYRHVCIDGPVFSAGRLMLQVNSGDSHG